MLALIRRDVRNRRKDVRAVCGRALNAIPVVDAALARLVVDVEVLQVVVEVYASGAEVAAEEGCVGCEDGADVDVPLSAEGDGEACLPFVEVCDDGGG